MRLRTKGAALVKFAPFEESPVQYSAKFVPSSLRCFLWRLPAEERAATSAAIRYAWRLVSMQGLSRGHFAVRWQHAGL